ncbi:MAG: lysophospholipid acyltransferase family protein [Desulfovibrio sp.]|uniref:lysophospholipid acyltransferase family protein n=1 Tax=Desulfovibrio sp. 7SRBS1 TaxID=3378064 RepID=UPI003B3E1BD6
MREVLYEALAVAGRQLSLDTVDRLGCGFGDLLWRLLPKRRAIAEKAMIHHLGIAESEARKMCRVNFQHTGRGFMEILAARKADWRFFEKRVELEHREYFEELMRTDRPRVIVTCHLGSWELTNGLLNLLFSDTPRVILGRRLKDSALNEVLIRLRTHRGVGYIMHRKAVFPVLRTLRRNGIFAPLVDHNCLAEEALFLPFMNDLAAVNRGPALLAVRAGAVLFPAAMVRLGNGRYKLMMGEPLDSKTLPGTMEERTDAVTRYYNDSVLKLITRYPEQWFWMHRRWKTRPPEGS